MSFYSGADGKERLDLAARKVEARNWLTRDTRVLQSVAHTADPETEGARLLKAEIEELAARVLPLLTEMGVLE